MTITPHDRATFLVQNLGEKHFVDAMAYNAHGKCDCWGFIGQYGHKKRIEKAIAEKTFVPGSDWLKCPHMRAVDDWLLRHLKKELHEQYPDSDQTPFA